MNNKQIQYAIELSKCLNFSQVADKLKISQPALSKQISNLEKELGVQLFDRSKTPISLTAAGEYFLREAENVIYKQEQLYRSMDKFKSGKQGTLVIGVSPFRSLYLMPQLAKTIRAKYPNIKIVLHEYSSDILRKSAAEGKYDFAIVNLPVDESLLNVIPIEQDKLVLAVPENLLSSIDGNIGDNLAKINFSNCEKLPFIVASQTQEMRLLFEKMCRTSNINPNISMEVVSLASAWAMTRAGIGATLLPLQFIQNMEIDKSIKLFTPDYDTNIRKPAIIMRHGQYLSEYAQYAIEILSENDKTKKF